MSSSKQASEQTSVDVPAGEPSQSSAPDNSAAQGGENKIDEHQAAEQDNGVLEKQSQAEEPLPPPHTIFTSKEVGFIVGMASLAALLSPLSSTIYFPALTTLANQLNVSDSLINLTVTTYLIMQGIAPTFLGTWSDTGGRRPLYLLAFTISIGANIGLALQTNYAALLVLRLLQAAGSSGTISLAYAIVADVATSSERGRYIGYVSIGAMVGPAIAPVLGGILIQFLGWRAVFWALAIFAGFVLVIFAIFFPETCRNLVGNGSIPPQSWNVSLLSYLHTRSSGQERSRSKNRGCGFPNPLASLKIFTDIESCIILMVGGVVVAGFQMIAANLSEELQARYNYNALQVGLCFIPMGSGSIVATEIVGRLVDWNFRRHAALQGITITKGRNTDDENFPIELARCQILIPAMLLCTVSILTYGWVLEYKTNLAGPLIMLFVLGFGLIAAANIVSALLVDLNLSQPATASAAWNLSRGLLGAGGVAAVSPIINAIGIGWTGTLIAAVCLIATPLLLFVIKFGPNWRKAKKERAKAKAAS